MKTLMGFLYRKYNGLAGGVKYNATKLHKALYSEVIGG